jgi:hypothetical protein
LLQPPDQESGGGPVGVADEDLVAAAQLRQRRAALAAASARHGAEEVQLRLLTDYDAAFGLDEDAGVA